ncbi:sugar-binding transcriptional regulator [Streptococcus halichoeri]|uniref:sugar-binding transcriptional regulator n=1 Tax=Streptococcus halichoeri TaxID=254785 RepID=UPI000DB0B819|nr:sugar-binding domain-containing protein [Streptococcus halichoeri]PZO96372.1 MAG: citrate lyase [Streptococcus pyogenes]
MENKTELLTKIAQDYYISGLSIGQIVDKYHLSRYLVNKYLEEAKQEKIVTITIHTPLERQRDLEKKIHDLFDIDNIYIIKDSQDTCDQESHVITFAASEIFRHIQASRIVGTVWGETISEIIEQFPQVMLEDCTFTQFIGENKKYKSKAGTMRMVQKIADKFSANYLTLSGPLYIAEPNTRKGMLEEFSSQPTLAAAKQMDLIFCGLGTLASLKSIPIWRDHLKTLFPKINTGDIAGMAYGRPYDIHGNFLNQDSDCTFGIDLATIFKVPKRICVVRSKFKSQATIGALRGRLFTDLILTESVARRLLDDLK